MAGCRKSSRSVAIYARTLPAMNLASLDSERGGRLVLEMNSPLSPPLVKAPSGRAHEEGES